MQPWAKARSILLSMLAETPNEWIPSGALVARLNRTMPPDVLARTASGRLATQEKSTGYTPRPVSLEKKTLVGAARMFDQIIYQLLNKRTLCPGGRVESRGQRATREIRFVPEQ